MGIKELRSKTWFKIISNKYVLILIVFTFWMLFFDSNSWLVHHELNQEIEKLENNEKYYQTEIDKDKATMQNLKDSKGIEKYAREKYFMKRENEDVYIIEYEDSLKKE